MADETDDPDEEQSGPTNGSPSVALELYDLSVTVDGGPEDDLDDLQESATDLMDYLVEQHFDLEDGPDDRDRF